MTFRGCWLFLIAAVAACDRVQPPNVAQTTATVTVTSDSARNDSIARARQDSINRAQPGYIVDSLLPIEEELRRFRASIGGTPVSALSGGSAAREELVRRLVKAVVARDTVDLRAMTLTAREFADLVYPTSRYTKPPYRQPPGLVWMQITQPSASGFRRLLERRGGMAFEYVDHSCKTQPEVDGESILWSQCSVRLLTPERETTTQRWFGSILQRNGMFKIASFANQF